MSEGIQERLDAIYERIRKACERANRDENDVELVAVSKKQDAAKIREAAECGLRIFGESRVQETVSKMSMCPGHISWHMIGHLQTNKVKQAVRIFDVIHSIDSLKLLETVQEACDQAGRQIQVCLQVNVSGERSKFGVEPDALPELLDAAVDFHRLDIVGLMTMPPWAEDPEKARPYFRQLRELAEDASALWGAPITRLSMGMSHDFEVAIEEGATWVRVGTDVFGSRS